MKNEIVLFQSENKDITIPVSIDEETVWLNRNQIAKLFDRDVKTIGKHINNTLKEELKGDRKTYISNNTSIKPICVTLYVHR